jgi:anti-sigma B factor antagonist
MSDDLAPSELTATLEREDGRAVLRVEGEIDLLTTPVLVEALDGALGGADALTVDLCAVDFMDSTGLRALLEARRRADEAGGVLFLRVRDGGPVDRLLDLAGVRDLFGPSGDG